MDEHARRVCAPLLASWDAFQQGQATLLDLSRLAEQASDALDNSNAPLPAALREAAADLEYAYHASEREEHASAGRRLLGPLLAEMSGATAELCSSLVGMTAAAATNRARQHGYCVRSSVIGVGAVFTADNRADRITLLLSADDVVLRAEVY
jgi:hypothetical protein